jgi:hypothetical protein
MACTRASTRFLPAADPPNLVAHIRTWRACDVAAATVRVTDGAIRSISARALLMPRPHRPVVPAGDLKAEFALLREARLAVILSDWGHYDGGGHDHSSAHCSGRTINVWNRRCRLQWATAHYLAASPWS